MKRKILTFTLDILDIFRDIVILWLVIGLWACAHKINEHETWHEEQVICSTNRSETPESKLMMVAMRCHKLEQELDMLRLRIEEMEESNETVSANDSICRQFYLWNSALTNAPTKSYETNIVAAIDDLVP